MTTKKDKAHKPHWYLMHVSLCPVCGKDNGYRVRVYGTKPKDAEKRRVYESQHHSYCGCMDGEFYR